ncbi:hypothetical protein XAB3213_4230011 [Xanthomonas citri pv. bilvae]|nr:hypothetical protein XAB3213_4230011 [Xanthomonas citri pv. bilvae]
MYRKRACQGRPAAHPAGRCSARGCRRDRCRRADHALPRLGRVTARGMVAPVVSNHITPFAAETRTLPITTDAARAASGRSAAVAGHVHHVA